MLVAMAPRYTGGMMDNRCEWEDGWFVDYSYADDGFGNMVSTSLMSFWFNVEQIRVQEH